MYFPDLQSVKKCAETMARHQKPENLYRGIIPKNGNELPQARHQLGEYFREVWKDEIQALEIELAVSEDNYQQRMTIAVIGQIFSSK